MHDTRIAVHAALQAAAGVGRTLLPPRPDDSHHSFTWSREHEAFVQGLVDGRFRSGLRPRDLTLLWIDARNEIGATFPLRGKTVADGFRFYEERVWRGLVKAEVSNEPLHPDEAELATLTRLYAQAADFLERIATPVRLWPHHFDIAVLMDALGVGFLAGDDAIDEPYWYVYNTPMPDPLPPLPVGEWYRGEWTGAVLKGDPDVETIERFLGGAMAALR